MCRFSFFPKINTFVFTDEHGNPWRCQDCATKGQHDKAIDFDISVLNKLGIDPPLSCRECGLHFNK